MEAKGRLGAALLEDDGDVRQHRLGAVVEGEGAWGP